MSLLIIIMILNQYSAEHRENLKLAGFKTDGLWLGTRGGVRGIAWEGPWQT